MTTTTLSQGRAASRWTTYLFAGLMGLGLMTVAGHLQAGALHDAAHDMRHATGFPCH